MKFFIAAISLAKNIPLTTLRNTNRQNKKDKIVIPFVITDHPKDVNIIKASKQFLPILEQSHQIKKSSIICRRHQRPNLKELLTNGKFTLNVKMMQVK